ncbi:MAG TPA: hypothetical protein VM938_07675 [Acidimicrobiales bacterium]|nr:hypothetical protein [Acidimicrobiales bacterium]
MIDSLVLPERPFADLHDDVLRRSARLRSARRRRFGLATTALASAVAVAVAMAGGPIGYDVSTPAGPAVEGSPVDTSVVATPPPPTAGGATVVAPQAPRLSDSVPGVRPLAPAFAPRTWVLVNDGGLSEVDGLDRTVRPVESPTGMEMRWSPDGTSLVRGDDDDLWVADRRIFDGSDRDAAAAPVWLPDNRTVVFVRRQGLVEPTHALWAVDVRAGALKRVRDLDGGGVTPTVAPDGRIAYQCAAGGYARVCLTDRTGADLGVVPGSDWYGHLSWSPDGAWIAVTVGFGGPSSGVMLLRPDGSARHAVVRERVTRRPVWFADSTRLVVDLLPPDSVLPDNQPCTQAPCPDDTGIWSVALDGSDARLVVDAHLGALLDARSGT